MSKKITSIIMQTVVGLVLMRIALRYLSNHPAEKVGIFSTFDYIYQKGQGVSKLFHGRTKNGVSDLEQFKNSFNELKQVMSTPDCLQALQANKVSTESVDQIIQTLESTTSEEFTRDRSKYIAVFNRVNEEIHKYCK